MEELDKLIDDGFQFVTHKTDELYNTDYYITEGSKTTGNFFSFLVDDGYMMVYAPADMKSSYYDDYTVTGKVIEMDSVDRQVRTKFASDIGVDSSLIPSYYISLKAPRAVPQVVSAAGAVLILLALINIVKSIGGLANYKSSKYYKSLMANCPGDPEQTAASLEAELAQNDFVIRHGDLIITRSWVCSGTGKSFAIRPVGDLIWSYKNVTQHRTNGIPTGKSYAVMLRFASGATEQVPAKNENDCDQLLASIHTRCPGAIMGYKPEWDGLFTKNLAQFRQMVDQFRQETGLTAQPAPVQAVPVQPDPAQTTPQAPYQPYGVPEEPVSNASPLAENEGEYQGPEIK